MAPKRAGIIVLRARGRLYAPIEGRAAPSYYGFGSPDGAAEHETAAPLCALACRRICYTTPARYGEVRPWSLYPVSQGRRSGLLAALPRARPARNWGAWRLGLWLRRGRAGYRRL